MKLAVASAAFIAALSTSVHARPHPHYQQSYYPPQAYYYQQARPRVRYVRPQVRPQVRYIQQAQTRVRYVRRIRNTHTHNTLQNHAAHLANNRPTQNYLPHPEGCPRTNFCACGAAADLGIDDRDKSLWAAASWYKFPRSHPAPNTVAVANHHVFVLKQDMGNGQWLVADYNSGGHLSRLHVRGIAGYTIVNPMPYIRPRWNTFVG